MADRNTSIILTKVALYPTMIIFGGWIVANWNYYYYNKQTKPEWYKKEMEKFKLQVAPAQQTEQKRQQLEAKWAEQRAKAEKIKAEKNVKSQPSVLVSNSTKS